VRQPVAVASIASNLGIFMERVVRYSRRRFIGTAAEVAALAAVATTLKPLAAIASAVGDQITVYDPRFAAAEPLAFELAGAGRLLPINGDPTMLFTLLENPGRNAVPPRLQGVTTESIPFCLHQWVPGRRLNQRRLDRDLFIWLLEGP
jgi:hypothetical protein